MKKTIPIQKEITFRTMIKELTEISLEHSLSLVENHTIEGNLIILGRYKMTEASTIEEAFQEEVPVTIELDEKYDTSMVDVSIGDFYYEIINDSVLRVSASIIVDHLEEKTEFLETSISSDREELQSADEIPEVDSFYDSLVEEVPILVEDTQEAVMNPVSENNSLGDDQPVLKKIESHDTETNVASGVGSIFSALENTEETFSTYYVYIVRDGDTLDKILDDYHVTREELADYNNLDDVKIGTKLIIPCGHE